MKTWQKLKENPLLFQRYFIKEYIIKACRKFFEEKNYHELESPIITNALPQERYINVLTTEIKLANNFVHKAYLTPTTETFNKKILAAGLGEHFVITKVLRGLEEIGKNHSPEFTMLEWYHLNASYIDLMTDCEELFKFIFKFVKESLVKEKGLNRFPIDLQNFKEENILNYLGNKINIGEPWHRVSIPNAIKEFLRIDLQDIQSIDSITSVAKKFGFKVDKNDNWQSIFEWLWASEIEPNLPKDKPVFVYDFPKQICVLTNLSTTNPLVCERVEIYLAGKEIGNGYTELLNAKIQKENFLIEQKARKDLGLDAITFDNDLIHALEIGLPNVAGIGIGLDRVAMIFANASYISDINYFPVSEWINE